MEEHTAVWGTNAPDTSTSVESSLLTWCRTDRSAVSLMACHDPFAALLVFNFGGMTRGGPGLRESPTK